MKCNKCVTENLETANFCINCGNRLDQEPAVQPAEEPEIIEEVTVQEEPAVVEETAAVEEPATVIDEAAAEEEPAVIEEAVIEEAPAVQEPEPALQKWYYVENKEAKGPVDQYEIEAMLADGRLTPSSYIWTENMKDWVKVSDSQFAELLSLPADEPAPAAQPAQEPEVQYEYTQPEPAPAEAVEWFYVQNNHTSGPFNQEVIRQLIENGTITADTYVWKEGMKDWAHVRDTELASMLPLSSRIPSAPAGPAYNNDIPGRGLVKHKSIILYIVLYIVTCSIWGLVWIYNLASDVNNLAEQQNKPKGADPVLAVLLTIITCGFYMIYFFWKEGSTVGSLDYPGYKPENQGALLAVLALFVPVVSAAILQDQINTILKYGK